MPSGWIALSGAVRYVAALAPFRGNGSPAGPGSKLMWLRPFSSSAKRVGEILGQLGRRPSPDPTGTLFPCRGVDERRRRDGGVDADSGGSWLSASPARSRGGASP